MPRRTASTSPYTAIRLTLTYKIALPKWPMRWVHPPAQVALAWLLHKTGVTAPIVGATKASQIADAVAAAELALSRDDLSQLEELYQPHRVAGHR